MLLGLTTKWCSLTITKSVNMSIPVKVTVKHYGEVEYLREKSVVMIISGNVITNTKGFFCEMVETMHRSTLGITPILTHDMITVWKVNRSVDQEQSTKIYLDY